VSTGAAALYLARRGWLGQGPAGRPDAPAGEVAEAARLAGFGPLVWEAVRKGARHDSAGFEELEPVHRWSIKHDLLRAGPRAELVQLIEDTRRRGLLRRPAALLKGGHLHRTVYAGRTHLRPMSDLDVLVSSRDLPVVRRVFAERGFRPRPEPGPELHRRWINQESWSGYVGEIQLSLDLHYDLEQHARRRPWTEHLLRSARPLPGDPPAFGLAPQHLVASLAAHAAAHHFHDPLRAAIEVDLVLEHERLRPGDLGWQDRVIRTARTPLSVLLELRAGLRREVCPDECSALGEPPAPTWRHRLLVALVRPEISSLEHPAERGNKPADLVRVLLAMDEPVRRALYPAYVAAVQGARLLEPGGTAVSAGAASAVAEALAEQGSASDHKRSQEGA